jgi:hypothetical protein
MTLVAVLAVALALGGCKKKGEESGASSAPPPSPAVDCAQLLPKVQECGDAFFDAWFATEQGKNSAKEFKTMLVDPTFGPQLCKDNWSAKDNRWNARYNKCWETPDCAAWVPCMADALGNLLPVPGT